MKAKEGEGEEPEQSGKQPDTKEQTARESYFSDPFDFMRYSMNFFVTSESNQQQHQAVTQGETKAKDEEERKEADDLVANAKGDADNTNQSKVGEAGALASGNTSSDDSDDSLSRVAGNRAKITVLDLVPQSESHQKQPPPSSASNQVSTYTLLISFSYFGSPTPKNKNDSRILIYIITSTKSQFWNSLSHNSWPCF